jgi:hypothetical protein
MASIRKRARQGPNGKTVWLADYVDQAGKRHNKTFLKRADARAWLADQGFLKKTQIARDPAEVEVDLLNHARDVLNMIVAMLRRHEAVTPESATLITSSMMTIAMLEHEIGRRLTGSLLPWEVARSDDDA